MTKVLSALTYLTEHGLIRPLDLEFARYLWLQEIKLGSELTLSISDDEAYCRAELIAKYGALVSVYLGKGHVCVQLESLISDVQHPLLGERADDVEGLDVELLSLLTFDLKELPLLTDCVSVAVTPTKPLMLETSSVDQNTRLYLNRYWHFEESIASFVQKGQGVTVDETVLANILATLFPDQQEGTLDYQKLAAAVALTSSMSVITGGPGTGKTYTVVRILAALIQYHFELSNSSESQNSSAAKLPLIKLPVIKLAAPTGKAAARMLESIRGALDSLPLDETLKAAFPETASTLHRLLGPKPLDANFKHHRKNPLHLDILIVDEASMIDLPMMAKLLDAMPEHGRLVLLGDRDQLASVEAGAVLNDLCQSLGAYSKERADQLSGLIGMPVDYDSEAKPNEMQDYLAWLKVSRRFGEHSGIGHLAKAINAGQSEKVIHVLSQDSFSDVNAIEYTDADYSAVLTKIAEAYESYILAAQAREYRKALTEFSKIRLLCALRAGDFGVQGLNLSIEDRLVRRQVIDPYVETNSGRIETDWYVGRPVMVIRNDHSLGLYNGDIGVVMIDPDGRLRVYFDSSDGLKAVLPSRMPEHETAYAMTVHKSQGSEFDHTFLILPDRLSPVLTRELIYTGVTRAKSQLSLMYDAQVLKASVTQRVQRFSGLKEKLMNT